jgi:serine/threonine-protein kinase
LPPELDPVFERALAKEPSRRFETCADFVAALRAAFAEAAGSTSELPAVVPLPTAPTRQVAREEQVAYAPARASRGAWPLLGVLLLAGALGGALLAYFLTRDEGTTKSAPTTVITQVRTVTTQGQTRTVERPVTVTTSASPPPTPRPTGQSGTALNDAGFRKMQAGDFAGALPLLEQAVQKLQGTGSLTEAYASYNLAYTRFQLGRCYGVIDLLDRSESIQGHRDEIDSLRSQAEERCG